MQHKEAFAKIAILGNALFAATIARSLTVYSTIATQLSSSKIGAYVPNEPVIAATTSPTPMNLGAR